MRDFKPGDIVRHIHTGQIARVEEVGQFTLGVRYATEYAQYKDKWLKSSVRYAVFVALHWFPDTHLPGKVVC